MTSMGLLHKFNEFSKELNTYTSARYMPPLTTNLFFQYKCYSLPIFYKHTVPLTSLLSTDKEILQ